MTKHDQRSIYLAISAIMWTLCVALGVVGTVTNDIRLLFWGGFAAMLGCIVANHLVMQHAMRQERLDLERMVDGLIAAAKGTDVTRLR